jgi:hypothetical protein
MNTITAQVVMLPTNDKTLLKKFYIVDKYQLLFKHNHIVAPYQHLYFTSDEPIQDCDWYIDDCNQIRKSFTSDKEYWKPRTSYKKIIASTDPALGLPAIPTAWIRDEYVLSNGSIKEVRLETTYDGTICKDVPTVNTLSHSDYCKGNHEVIYKLKLTPGNEVVIVDGAMDIFEKVVDGYVSHEEGLKQLKQMETEQELEDAANKYSPDPVYNDGQWEFGDVINGFKAGAAWQKEQSATDASEFVDWTHKNLWAPINNDGLWYNKNKVYQYKTECLTTKQLYELWQQNK